MAFHLEKVFYIVSFSVLTKLLLSHLSASFRRLISSVGKERAIIDNFLFMFFKGVFTYKGYAINRRTPCAFHITLWKYLLYENYELPNSDGKV